MAGSITRNQFWFEFTGLTMEQTAGRGGPPPSTPTTLTASLESGERRCNPGNRSRSGLASDGALTGCIAGFLPRADRCHDREGRIVKWFGLLAEIEGQKQGQKVLAHQRNALVRLVHQVTVAAYEVATVEDALQAGVDQVCADTGWPVGHVYVLAGDVPRNSSRLRSGIWADPMTSRALCG